MKAHKKNKIYSPELKISCIIDLRTNHLGYGETAEKYNIGNSESQGRILLSNWERKYLEEGEASFYVERRGRTTKMESPTKGRKKSLSKNVRQDLISQNQQLKKDNEYLRAENEYLKKLDALVRAEKQKKNKKR